MIKITLILISLFSFAGIKLPAQDLDKLLEGIITDTIPDYAYGTFKGITIINGQSVEIAGQNDLNFLISHRFGAVNSGLYNLFGLDQGTTRLGFEYGISDILAISLGRSSYEKTYDLGMKLKVLRQQKGLRNIPVTLTVYTAGFMKTLKWEDPDRDNLFSSRMAYSTQLLIARKFNSNLSIQLSPSFVHFNLVEAETDQNNVFSAGIGGRYKLARKFSVNGEYYFLFPGKTADDYSDSFSLGFDIETGGHVFQIHFTNSQLMYTPGFIARTDGNWMDGEIFIGFNIYRIFPLVR
jgi:hypothetical protein